MESGGMNHKNFIPVLTRANIKEGEAASLAVLTQELYDRGFNQLRILMRTSDGKFYTRQNGKLYVCTWEIDGDKLRLKDVESGEAFAGLLGRFHISSEGFMQQPGVKLRVCWGKRAEKYRLLTSRLEKYAAMIKNEGCSCRFEDCTSEHIDYLLLRARASMKVLKSTRYLMALENSMRQRQVCLNAISNNTVRITEGGLVIVNVFNIGYNMIEEDIACLVKKVIEETGDKGAFEGITEAYEKERGNREYCPEIVRALASFPENSLRIIARYMKAGEGNECLSEKYLRYAEKEIKCGLLEV